MAHRVGQALVHGEPGAAPVTGGAQLLLLLHDAVAELVLPVPHPLQELLPAQIVAGQALALAQLLLHLDLGGDAGVVGAGHPQGGIALHPLEADQDVLEGAVHGVAHVELAGDVGGRHDDGEGAFVRVAVALKAAVLLPHLIDAALHLPGFIDLRQFLFHLLHSFSGQSKKGPPQACCSGRTRKSAVPPEFPRVSRGRSCLANGRTRRALLYSGPELRDDLPCAAGGPCTKPAPLCTARAGTPSLRRCVSHLVYAKLGKKSRQNVISPCPAEVVPPFTATPCRSRRSSPRRRSASPGEAGSARSG